MLSAAIAAFSDNLMALNRFFQDNSSCKGPEQNSYMPSEEQNEGRPQSDIEGTRCFGYISCSGVVDTYQPHCGDTLAGTCLSSRASLK